MINEIIANEQFNIKMLEGFKNIDVSLEELMIFEAVSFKLQEIQDNIKDDSYKYHIYNSKYAIDYEGEKVINVFKDVYGIVLVNPLDYYEEELIKESNILKLIKEIIRDDFSNKNISGSNMCQIAAIVIGKVQSDVFSTYIDGLMFFKQDQNYIINPFLDLEGKKVNPDDIYCGYSESPFLDIIYDHYCYSLDKFEKLKFERKEVSKKDQKDIIIYMLNNIDNIDFIKDNYLETFFFDRNNSDCYSECDLIRVLIIEFLQWHSDHYIVLDKYCFIEEQSKVSFKESLFLLFVLVYEYKYNTFVTEKTDVFKSEILKNNEIKDLFFNVLRILLNNPNEDGFKEVRNFI